jgi:hypothetical protein
MITCSRSLSDGVISYQFLHNSSISPSVGCSVLLSFAWKMTFSIRFTFVGEPESPHCLTSALTSATLHSSDSDKDEY